MPAPRALPKISIMALLACSCASDTVESEPSMPEAGAPARDASLVPPVEANPITLTLGPFWEIELAMDSFVAPVPLDGVEVCVEQRRGHMEPWEAFVPVDRAEWPCTTTVAGENAVLEVPALSELVLTAKKEGFVPSVLAVTTGQWDQGQSFGVYERHLHRPEGLQALPDVDLRRGLIFAYVVEELSQFGGGYRPRLQPEAGSLAQIYGGIVYPDAGATLPGQIFSSSGVADPSQYAGSVFYNLPEGEYAVSFEQEGTYCEPNPVVPAFGDPREGVRRVPVRDRHFSLVGLNCGCRVPPDAMRCGPGDGGS